MPRNCSRCTGGIEYANGCTTFGYACSSATVGALVLVIPLLHLLYFSDPPAAPLHACLKEVNLTAEAHVDALSLYFRYDVKSMQRCTIETKILRGCVANDTQVVKFVRYPPGPLRAKNLRDVVEKFQYIEKNYLDVAAADVVARTPPAARNACAKPGANFARLMPRLTSPPYSVSLRNIPPFDSILYDRQDVFKHGGGGGASSSDETEKNSSSSSSLSSSLSSSSSSSSPSPSPSPSPSSPPPPMLRYVDYVCLAAVEHALEVLDAATEVRGESGGGGGQGARVNTLKKIQF